MTSHVHFLLDCLCLPLRQALVFRTEADICIYLPSHQLLSQAHMHTTLSYTSCLASPIITLSSFSRNPFLCFASILLVHIRVVSHFPPLFLLRDSTHSSIQQMFPTFHTFPSLISSCPWKPFIPLSYSPPLCDHLCTVLSTLVSFHFRPRVHGKLLNKTSPQAIYLS